MSINPAITGSRDDSLLRSLQQPVDGKAQPQGADQYAAWRHEMERAQYENWFKPFDQTTPTPSARPAVTAQAVPQLHAAAPPLHLTSAAAIHLQPQGLPSQEPQALQAPQVPATNESGGSQSAGDVAAVPSQSNGMSNGAHHLAAHTSMAPACSAQEGASPVNPARAPDTTVLSRQVGGTGEQATADGGMRMPHLAQANALPSHLSVAGSPFALPETIRPLDAAIASAVAQSADLASDRHPTGAATESAVSGPANAAPQLTSNMSPPVRLHVQWVGQAANIWLGMDGSAQQVASQVKIIVAELRRHFSALGQRIGSITCNGSVVFDGQANSKISDEGQFASHVDAAHSRHLATQQTVNSNVLAFSAPNFQEEI